MVSVTEQKEQEIVHRLRHIISECCEEQEIPTCRDVEVRGCFIVWSIDDEHGSMTILGNIKPSQVLEAVEIALHAKFIKVGAIQLG